MADLDTIKAGLDDAVETRASLKSSLTGGGPDWNADRDGQLFSTVGMSPKQWLYNTMLLPGWQKWKPTFRYGTITAISDEGKASVSLDTTIKSSAQGLSVNQSGTLTDVMFEYMVCDHEAFAVDDEVIVMYYQNDDDEYQPKIIGFRENPKPCPAIIPWISASENYFDSGGILLCHGGETSPNDPDVSDFAFTEEFELFSPFGATSYNSTSYQPFEYNGVQIEWQVKEFTDDAGVVWNELPWMGSGIGWDPVFYETYDEQYTKDPKPYCFEFVQVSFKRAGEYYPDYWVVDAVSHLKMNDQVFAINTSSNWYTGTYGEPLDWYWDIDNRFDLLEDVIDQDDPTKYGVIYTSYDMVAGPDSDHWPEEETTIYSNYQMTFDGLGHTHTFTEYNSNVSTSCRMRMYKLNDQYVILFGLKIDTTAYLGIVAEGGEFTLLDVSNGIEYEDVNRTIVAGCAVGLIQRCWTDDA